MTNEDLILYELRVIKERLSKLERQNVPFGPYTPSQPINPISKVTHCSTCGIKFEGVMGYVCNRGDCPSGMGPVMC